MRPRTGGRWGLAALLLALAGEASAQPVCAYPVLDESGDRPILQPLVSPDLLMSMPSPVVTPVGHDGRWWIDGHRLVRYDGFWPVQSYLDAKGQKVEPWSGRVVATTWASVTSVLDPGADSFRVIGTAHIGPFVLPRHRITVVLTGDRHAMVVRPDKLEPWAVDSEVRGHGIRALSSVHDSEILGAIVAHDQEEQRLWARTDAGNWHRLAELGRWEFGDVLDAPRSGAAIYLGQKIVLALRREYGSFITHTLAKTPANDAAATFYRSALLGELLHYGPGGFLKLGLPRWLRLRGARFEDIPGFPPGLPEKMTSYFWSVRDLPSLGKVMLRGRDGLYLYDGERATPVTGSDWTASLEPSITDLPTVGRVVVRARGRSEELIDGRLREVPQIAPFRLVDWPGQGVLGWTRDQLVLLDANLDPTPITLPGLGEGVVIHGVSRTASSRTGALFVSTSEGLFVLGPKRVDCR
jgi:hypothetical protein